MGADPGAPQAAEVSAALPEVGGGGWWRVANDCKSALVGWAVGTACSQD
jgi:hypothetical protein